MKHECVVCGWIYDQEAGVPDMGIEPGTPFDQLPEGFECPDCNVGVDEFEAL